MLKHSKVLGCRPVTQEAATLQSNGTTLTVLSTCVHSVHALKLTQIYTIDTTYSNSYPHTEGEGRKGEEGKGRGGREGGRERGAISDSRLFLFLPLMISLR